MRERSSHQHLQRRIVLLHTRAVYTRTIRDQLRIVRIRIPQQRASEKDISGDDIEFSDARRIPRWGPLRIIRAIRGRGIGIIQRRLLCEADSHLAQRVVHFKHLGSVYRLWIFRRVTGTLAKVPSREVLRDLARINLILQRNLNRVPRERHVRGGAHVRIDPRDARDHEVRFAQVELSGEDERRHRSRSVDLAFADDDLADVVRVVAVDVGEEWGEAREGDVVREEVEVRDAVPGFRFVGEHGDDEEFGGDAVIFGAVGVGRWSGVGAGRVGGEDRGGGEEEGGEKRPDGRERGRHYYDVRCRKAQREGKTETKESKE